MRQLIGAYEQGGMDSISNWFIRDIWWKSGNGTFPFPSISVFPITVFSSMLQSCVRHKNILTKKPERLKLQRNSLSDFENCSAGKYLKIISSALIIARKFKTVDSKIQLFECIVCKSNLVPTFLISTHLSPNLETRLGLIISRIMLKLASRNRQCPKPY